MELYILSNDKWLCIKIQMEHPVYEEECYTYKSKLLKIWFNNRNKIRRERRFAVTMYNMMKDKNNKINVIIEMEYSKCLPCLLIKKYRIDKK